MHILNYKQYDQQVLETALSCNVLCEEIIPTIFVTTAAVRTERYNIDEAILNSSVYNEIKFILPESIMHDKTIDQIYNLYMIYLLIETLFGQQQQQSSLNNNLLDKDMERHLLSLSHWSSILPLEQNDSTREKMIENVGNLFFNITQAKLSSCEMERNVVSDIKEIQRVAEEVSFRMAPMIEKIKNGKESYQNMIHSMDSVSGDTPKLGQHQIVWNRNKIMANNLDDIIIQNSGGVFAIAGDMHVSTDSSNDINMDDDDIPRLGMVSILKNKGYVVEKILDKAFSNATNDEEKADISFYVDNEVRNIRSSSIFMHMHACC